MGCITFDEGKIVFVRPTGSIFYTVTDGQADIELIIVYVVLNDKAAK